MSMSDSDSDISEDFNIANDGSIILSKGVLNDDGNDGDEEEIDYTVPPFEDDEVVMSGGANNNTKVEVIEEAPLPDEDDYDDGDEAHYDEMRKLKFLNKEDIIRQYHPECIQMNYKEVEAYLTVVRDDRGNIIDKLHMSYPVLSKYEYTRIIGYRTEQLSKGAKPYIDIKNNMIIEDCFLIAQEEFKQGKLPFIIKRPYKKGFEFWRLSDLEYLRE